MVAPVPLAWQNLAHDKVRFALFAAGIAFAVVLMGVQLGIMNAMLDSNTAMIRAMRCDLVLVNPNRPALMFNAGVSRREWERAREAPRYWLTRFLILRLVGFVYLFAFLSLALQVLPLIGHGGLLPADRFLERVAEHAGSRWLGFWRLPSVFWLGISDRALVVLAWSGVSLSLVVVEAFRQSQIEVAASFNYTPYIATAIIFVALTVPMARFTDWLVARDKRRQQAGRLA